MNNHNRILQGIDTVIVRVSDIIRSKKWYQEKLGLTPTWDDPVIKLVVLDTGGPTSLTLWQTHRKIEINKDTVSYPIFRTINADQARQELQKKGVSVSEVIEDSDVRYFLMFDPDGNVLEACQVHE
jgi:catechol 2,3-dioxygenase-like lactoylglutathione lyase family enzyme